MSPVSVCRGLSDLFPSATPKFRVPFLPHHICIYIYAALGLSPSLPLWEPCHLQDFADRGCSYTPLSVASLVAQSVKNLPATQETWA